MSGKLVKHETGYMYPYQAQTVGVGYSVSGLPTTGAVFAALAKAELCFGNETKIVLAIPLVQISKIGVCDLTGTTIIQQTSTGLQKVNAYPPWGIEIEFSPPSGLVSQVVQLLVFERDNAVKWRDRIASAVNTRTKELGDQANPMDLFNND